jgi:hypothetical protein
LTHAGRGGEALFVPTIAAMSARDSMNQPFLRAGDVAMTTGRRA